MLSKIFMTRMNNDVNRNIFSIRFQETTQFSASSISRQRNICDARYLYLLTSPIKNRKISLISKLLLSHHCRSIFSQHFLERQISQELNIDINSLITQNLSSNSLINLYIRERNIFKTQ